MNKEFLTSLDFNGFRNLKDKKGVKFGYIEHEIRDKDEKVGMLKSSKIIDSYAISLHHWIVEEQYYTQWNIHQRDDTKLEPYISNVPIYGKENERNKFLKETLAEKFEQLDIEKVDSFLFKIYQLVENEDQEKMNKRFYRKLRIKTNDNNKLYEVDDAHKFQPIYPTSHLKCFDDLLDATGLKGNEYKSIMKPVWYNLVSLLIAKTELELGSIIVDGRIHILIFLPSGSGKTEIKKTIQRILNKMNKSNIEPTSFHPEQFMGKVAVDIKNGERHYRQLPGHLSLDYVIIDEGKNLLTSKDPIFSESRKYLRYATDQYPNNTITKKSVDIEQGHALSYEPHCCVCIFCQPFHMIEEFVLDGDLRRFIVSYILMVGTDKTKQFEMRVREKRDYKGSIDNFCNFLDSINIPENFELTEEATDTFVELHRLLVKRGSNKSPKILNFIKMIDYSIQNMLLKFSAIQALQESKGIIERRHVELAFIDYSEILEHTYDYIENKILGTLDYGENWNGAFNKDKELLKWLHEQGATSKENSKVSIKEYKEKIMEVYNVKEKQAGRYKAKHEEKGWIESKKGQHDSKVWIKFKPKIESSLGLNKVRVDKDFRDKYTEIINKYDSVIEK